MKKWQKPHELSQRAENNERNVVGKYILEQDINQTIVRDWTGN